MASSVKEISLYVYCNDSSGNVVHCGFIDAVPYLKGLSSSDRRKVLKSDYKPIASLAVKSGEIKDGSWLESTWEEDYSILSYFQSI